MAMFELMTVTVTMLRLLQLYLAMSIKRSAGERHDTDETTVNLLAFRMWVRLDDREAKGLPEGIGERNHFRTNGTTTEMLRTVRFPGTTGIFNLGDRRCDVRRVNSSISISRLVELHRMVKFEYVLAVEWRVRSCRRSRTMAFNGWYL